jgi:glycosyltransferase involved in cell wall biosynthesis
MLNLTVEDDMSEDRRRLKVLLSAYACEPGGGSEPGVGWNMAREMAKHHEVWVLTRANNRPVIDAELACRPIQNLHFVYYDLPRWAKWWKRGRRGVQLYYYLWQLGAYRVAKTLHRKVGIDLVHHVTFVNYWKPSFSALLPVPFIWGPVGGGESAPKAFWNDFGFRGKVYEAARELARWLGEHEPFVRIDARRSVRALATTEETATRLRKLGAKNIRIYPESGLSEEEIERLGRRKMRGEDSVRFASVGTLVHLKGFHLGLRAFAQAGLSDAEYWVVGDGPERQRLQALAKEQGIAHQVKFWGRLPRDDTLGKLGDCHVLVHPTLHDSGGWVCLEAMAAGCPVICLDLGGPSVQVTEETGFKVPAGDPEQAVKDLAVAMRRLSKDHDLRTRMGEAGRRRVDEHFSWSKKGVRVAELYREVLPS